MEITEHIDALAREGSLLAAAGARADFDAAVPPCPEWHARDVLQHTGEVHRWAAFIVGEQVRDAEEKPVTFPPDDELLDWFGAGHATLIETLADAPADLECFAFLPAPSPLAFWARRQAHETAIHRADAESATGAITPFPADFATDGIDELLYGFASRRRRQPLRIDRPIDFGVHANDTGRVWTIHLRPDGITVTDELDGIDGAVHADASDLYLLLWNRRGLDGVRVEGDAEIVAAWHDSHQVRWS
jgi:uncharacterized protein (TIGR03083 family)